MIQQHHRVCNLCEAMCGLEIEHDGQAVLSVRGDTNDPLSQGSICPKGALIHRLHSDPDRLKQPLRKTEQGEWEAIGWPEALDSVGERINAIRRAHGDDAVGVYLGNPTVHNFGSMLLVGELKRVLGTRNAFSATSMDQLPHHFMAYYMLGHGLNMPIPDIDHTQYMVIFGANPLASNGSLMSAPGVQNRLAAIQQRGGKVIQFDPRRNETSRIVDEHHFIRPGTDVYVLLGMLHLIQQNDWIELGHLTDHVKNLDKLTDIAIAYTPERVARITGVDAAVLSRITEAFVRTERAVLYGRMGMSTQEHGGLCHWLMSVLNILTSHFDRRGGAMFPLPAFAVKRTNTFRKAHGRWHSRVRGLPEFGGELPVSVMAEEIDTSGAGQIKALLTVAGNPVLSSPNGKRLEAALPQLDFMVSIDIFLNETTRHADIILPPPSHLEVDHYDVIFNLFAVRNNAKFSPALFAPATGQLFDWQIFKALIKRFAKVSRKTPSRLYRWLTPRQLLNLGLLTGPYGQWKSPRQWWSGLSLGKLIRSRHGIDLGPLQPRVPEVLNTADGKIDLAPEVFLQGLERVHAQFAQDAGRALQPGEFLLIGRRHLRSNNSWMHNVTKLMQGRNRCTVLMHPTDAADLTVQSSQEVIVRSATGAITLPVEISDDIMPGVVSIPHGFGHTRPGTRLAEATRPEQAGVSVNDITDHTRLDPLTGNAAFSGQVVTVRV